MLATDIMTENPRTIATTDAIGDAIAALQAMEVRHLPVVDDEGNLVGMLSDRDLGPLMTVFTEGAEAETMALPLSRRRVAELMSSDVTSVDTDTALEDVIDAMLEQRIGAVPVVDGEGTVVGIISYVDVLRALRPSESSNSSADRRRGRARRQA